MNEVFDQGDVVRCENEFSQNGTAIDPTAVFFQIKTPAGVPTTYQYGVDAALIKDSTGNYHVDIAANAGGTWQWRWYSTGTGAAADQGTFTVKQSYF